MQDEMQIRYLLFPEGEFSGRFLDAATDLMLHPENSKELISHNKRAVRLRYSTEMINAKFEQFFTLLHSL